MTGQGRSASRGAPAFHPRNYAEQNPAETGVNTDLTGQCSA
ncbi:hypothetical protein SAMN05428963_112116 [Consotaella salsifontis]|uniref:Uncharacterized protein n=1 Tax=Consotaella salsifontis TaxID=1365950 RepID=A0A1T4SPI5_9HYPH|nr:hypothetical protein SAMN05428963_112116 [Consotaella salsifontis]